MNSLKKAFKQAFPITIPVMCGYLFLGCGFGVLMSKAGYHFIWSTFTSITVFCGSMQYVAVDLLSDKFDILTAIIMTLAVNIRHLFYGLSLIGQYKGIGSKKFFCAFGLTDETYSLVCSQKVPDNVDKGSFYLAITILNHIYWICGCTVGGIIGQFVDFNAKGIDFVMTALFVVIFLEQWESTSEHSSALLGLGATLFTLVISRTVFTAMSGFFLIPSMIIIFSALAIFRNNFEGGFDKCNINR